MFQNKCYPGRKVLGRENEKGWQHFFFRWVVNISFEIPCMIAYQGFWAEQKTYWCPINPSSFLWTHNPWPHVLTSGSNILADAHSWLPQIQKRRIQVSLWGLQKMTYRQKNQFSIFWWFFMEKKTFSLMVQISICICYFTNRSQTQHTCFFNTFFSKRGFLTIGPFS